MGQCSKEPPPKTQNSSEATLIVNHCKQNKLPQTKATENVKFNEETGPVKGTSRKREKQCSRACLRNNGFKSGNINMNFIVILDLSS